MIIGMDIGSTLTKFAQGTSLDDVELNLDVLRTGPFTHKNAVDHLQAMKESGDVDWVAVTGSGANIFREAARKFPDVPIVPHTRYETEIERELRVQVEGVRLLAEREEGLPLPEAFTLVSVGTGTSYTLVDDKETIRPFPIGNSIGGGTLDGFSLVPPSSGIPMDWKGLDCKDESLFEQHGDILMKDRFPELADGPTGDFVLSSGGNIGWRTGGLQWVTLAKLVATQVARDLLLMQMMTDWKWTGPVVVIGMPVDAYPVVNYWLKKKVGMVAPFFGAEFRFIEGSVMAGALGAYKTALDAQSASVAP